MNTLNSHNLQSADSELNSTFSFQESVVVAVVPPLQFRIGIGVMCKRDIPQVSKDVL
jgi:hypothetical protein